MSGSREPVSFSEALELAEAHLGDLPYRQLMIDHEATGRRLERSFAEQRWEVDREVVMAAAAASPTARSS